MAANQQPIDLSSLNLTTHQLYPPTATAAEMTAWFPNGIPENPLRLISDKPRLRFRRGRAYTPASDAASSGPFHAPWVDDHNHTLHREKFHFLVNHGGAVAFDAADPTTYRSVHTNISNAAMPNGVINPAHWAWSVGANNTNTTNNNTISPWPERITHFLNKTNADARAGMVRAAKAVWILVNPQPGDLWYAHAQIPGRIVRIMLYYLRWLRVRTPAMVKFLIGDRIRSHLDVDALYSWLLVANYVPRLVQHPNIGGQPQPQHQHQQHQHQYQYYQQQQQQPQVDLVLLLADWLEQSCAHMLNEVFQNFYVRTMSAQTKTALRNNFVYIANRYPGRAVLEHNVADFPWKE